MTNEIAGRSLRADFRMIKRGCKIIRKLSPGLLSLSILNSFFSAFIPYIAIYMSAVIVDELVGNRNFSLLIFYVAAATGGTLLATIISELIKSKINVKNAMFDAELDGYLNNIKLSMDFIKLEDPKYTELRDKISGTTFMTGGGIASVVKLLTSIADNTISVIIAVIIIQNATMAHAATDAGAGLLNSILFFIFLMSVIAACITLTVKNSRTESIKEFRLYQDCATNRYLGYYHDNYMEDDQAGKDIHIFNQRKLIIGEVLSKGRLPWLKVCNGRYSLYQEYFGANTAISAFLGGFAYIFVGLKALSGSISLGSVTKSYSSIIRLVSSVGNLSVSLSQIKSNNNYLELLYEFIDIPSDMHNGKEIPAKSDKGWEIEFHNVSFRYPSGERYALKNLSLKISSNSRTAIVGMNGSGKTTMIKLLCGFYSPEEGYITLNGKNIGEYDYNAYLSLFSVVFQDFKFLAFPIGQNVAASKEYDEESVWCSLETAGIADRVRELKNNIGQALYKNFEEDGINISGGEEQKLAIARAIYKDAPFIVLDEPTAALDPVAEYEIYSKFNEIIGCKAAVFVSHRLSSCRFCDTIAVFQNGQIVQIGTHKELLKDIDGKYLELWNAQAQYYQ
jgi:ATP-binding cassette subfamily B protein